MHEIDFLPSEYRQKCDRRKSYDRRILAATLLAAVLAALAWNQQHRARRLTAELARREPAHTQASQTQQALRELQSRLQLAQASAELVTYLRHPWPRTQIIAALLGPLPDEIAFEELYIEQETSAGRESAERRAPAANQEKEEQPADLPPAARDLQRLREEADSKQTVVIITGVTTKSAALHQYLGELGREDLFSESQLQSIEVDPADPKRARFSARIVVRRGYGQPGGPTGPDRQAAPETDRKTT